MATIASVNDFNGDLFVGGQEGETLKASDSRSIMTVPGVPAANGFMQKPVYTADHVSHLWKANFRNNLANEPNLADLENHKICCMQVALFKMGLVNNGVTPEQAHVQYTDLRTVANDQVVAHAEGTQYHGGQDDTVDPGFTDDVKKAILSSMTDLICISAHFFKVRGHHWLQGAQEQYTNLMEKCNIDAAKRNMLPTAEHIFSKVMHCIYPVHKARFYERAVSNSHCCGAMQKRFHSTPAGSAILPVLQQGWNDLKLVVPGIGEKLSDEIDYLEEQVAAFEANPMSYSVNARYYGQQRVIIDEKRFGALAAIILAAIRSFQDDHPLAESSALQRVAALAPMTGAIIVKAIKKVGTSDRMVAMIEGQQ